MLASLSIRKPFPNNFCDQKTEHCEAEVFAGSRSLARTAKETYHPTIPGGVLSILARRRKRPEETTTSVFHSLLRVSSFSHFVPSFTFPRVFLEKLQTANNSMALYRSKLGPVGGGGGEGGNRDGGVVVDLDPLSAFALMGGGGAEAETSAPSSREAEHGVVSGGGATRPGKERSASPVTVLAGAAANTPDLESWLVAEVASAAPPPSQVCGFCYCAVVIVCSACAVLCCRDGHLHEYSYDQVLLLMQAFIVPDKQLLQIRQL